MWALLPRNIQFRIVGAFAIVAAVAMSVAYNKWGEASTSPIAWISWAALAFTALIIPIAENSWRWVWRTFPGIQPKTFPDLNGTWKGEMVSTWRDAGGNLLPPINTTITIRQGIFDTSVSLVTAETKRSESIVCELRRFPQTRRYQIWYSYANRPDVTVRERSKPHEGVAYLDLLYDTDPNRLTGEYYTDRSTTGKIDVYRR